VAQKFIVPITVRQLASAGSDAFTIYVDQDVYSRIQIQAGGRIVWGSGDAALDTNLYRDSANVLKTDDTFKAAGLFVDGIEIDPTGAASDQVLKFDGTKFAPGTASTVGLLNDLSDVTTASVAFGDVLTWNGTYWTNEEPTGGGASVTVSESAPASPAAGDLWFDSILGVMFIYYDSVWVEVGGGGVVNFVLDTVTAKGDLIVGTADGAADNLAVGSNGTYLKANSSTATGLEWASVPAIDAAAIISAAGGDGTNGQALTTNGSGVLDFTTIVGTTEASIISAVGADGAAGSVLKTNGSGDLSFGDVVLGTNTSGNYVASLVAGTGITLSNNSGETSTPTIAIGQSVAASATPTFAGLTLNGNITFEGATADDYETIIAITDPTSDRVIVFPDLTGMVVTTGDTGSITSLMIADNTIVNADINTSAAIELSKLASGASGQVVIANASGVPTYTAISGDITVDGSGVATISANSVALGTDTTGNYMSDLTQGTGVSITHTPGEGSNATIAIGQAVGTSASVQFAAVTAPLIGNASTATVLQTARNIAGQSFDGSTNISIAPTDLTGVTSTAAELNILDGATLSTTELNYVDGVTSAIQTQIDSKAPSASPTFTGVVTLPDNTVALGTKTTGDYVASLVAGTGVTLTNGTASEGGTPTIGIGQAVGTTSNVQFNDVTVDGNLTVNGTTTTLNTETLSIEDNIVVLNSNVTASPTTNAGVEIERGTSANVLVRWNETSDKWEVTNDGTTYGNIVTTADSGTVTSAMITDGTIVDGDISASAAIAHSKLANATPGQILLGTTTSGVLTATALSGDVTVNGAGVTAIGSGKVTSDMIVDGTIVNADINASAAIALTKLASGTSAQVVIANSSGIPTYTTLSGDITISDTGVASIAANSVALGTDTTGNYVSDVTASTGITVTHTPGEGSSATVALNATLDDLSNVSVATPSSGQFLKWNGTAWVADTIVGGASISDTAPASPTAGQIWFQSTNGKTFVYYDSQWIEVGGVGTGARMVSSSSAPASPLEGSMWFDTDTAQTFVYYDSQWIEIGASGVTASVQDSAPADPVSGQIWFNSLTGGTYVYYGTNWIEVGASPFSALVNTINAKGDLLVGTADNTLGGLTAGSAGQVLTVDSSTATGLKWDTPVSTGKAIAMSLVFGS
jgi:hypothetical protein